MLNGKGKVQFFLSYPLVPGEIAVDGIRFDFCDGCRILFPNKNGSHRVVLIDNDTGYVLQNTVVCEGGKFRSNIRYFVNWHIDIYNEDNKIIFNHDFSPVGKQVLFVINSNAIGDTLAWFPYIDKFARKHNCMAGVVMSDLMREIIEPEYPSITFFDRSAEKTLSPYASYMLGINYQCDQNYQKRRFTQSSLSEIVGCDLGFDNDLDIRPPRLHETPIDYIYEPYVCMATKGSVEYKCWNDTHEIEQTVYWLKNVKNCRVMMIDAENDNLCGAEDFTGHIPLSKRVALLRNCKAFVGMASGLSWLAWACDVPVVLLGGFSEPFTEFYTPYRVGNWNVCHGCWSNIGKNFTCSQEVKYKCSKMISSRMVINQLKRILGE